MFKIDSAEEFDIKKTSQVYKVIKHETDHEHLISKNLFVDCEAAKVLTLKNCISLSNRSVFRGMVQSVFHIPFGLILYTEIQVRRKSLINYIYFKNLNNKITKLVLMYYFYLIF